MDRWSSLTLRDAGVKLIDCVHKTPAAQENGYPYVAIPQMKDGWIDLHGARKISREDFCEWTKKAKPQQHDVVLSRRTNPGVTAIDRTGTDFALGQNLVLLRADGRQIAPPFLKWLVRSPAWWEQIEKFMNVGAVFNSLKCADVPNFELPVPPIKTQRLIGGLLDVIDTKIDLNRRMNETLEAMARAIFKDWFVDFGPTRAKIEGREPYLAPEIWDLFPDALDEDGKPEGWKNAPLKEFFSIIGGGTPKTSVEEYWDGEIPWFSVVDTPPKGSVLVTVTDKSITERGLEESSARLVPEGTTIISARGTVGNLAMAAQEMAFNQSCYALRANDRTGDCFVYLAAQHMTAQLRSMAHGSVFSTITRQTFEVVTLTMPLHAVTQAFEAFVEPLFLQIKSNVIETTTLSQTRDLLLPKLMSGEIRLRDAEGVVERVA